MFRSRVQRSQPDEMTVESNLFALRMHTLEFAQLHLDPERRPVQLQSTHQPASTTRRGGPSCASPAICRCFRVKIREHRCRHPRPGDREAILEGGTGGSGAEGRRFGPVQPLLKRPCGATDVVRRNRKRMRPSCARSVPAIVPACRSTFRPPVADAVPEPRLHPGRERPGRRRRVPRTVAAPSRCLIRVRAVPCFSGTPSPEERRSPRPTLKPGDCPRIPRTSVILDPAHDEHRVDTRRWVSTLRGSPLISK